MAEIVNLRRARKARDRAVEARQAAENRARHGRTKAQQESERIEAARLERHLDDHRREE